MKLTIPFETAEWYLPSKDRGAQILAEVIAETRTWRQTAVRAGISRADIELTAAAFVETDGYPARLSPVHSQHGVTSPSPANEANDPILNGEPTNEPDSSIDTDLEL